MALFLDLDPAATGILVDYHHPTFTCSLTSSYIPPWNPGCSLALLAAWSSLPCICLLAFWSGSKRGSRLVVQVLISSCCCNPYLVCNIWFGCSRNCTCKQEFQGLSLRAQPQWAWEVLAHFERGARDSSLALIPDMLRLRLISPIIWRNFRYVFMAYCLEQWCSNSREYLNQSLGRSWRTQRARFLNVGSGLGLCLFTKFPSWFWFPPKFENHWPRSFVQMSGRDSSMARHVLLQITTTIWCGQNIPLPYPHCFMALQVTAAIQSKREELTQCTPWICWAPSW